MNNQMMRRVGLLLMPLVLGIGSIRAASESALEEQISDLRRELSRIQQERQRVQEEITRDKKDFRDYQARTENRMRMVIAENDSVKREITRFSMKRDSIDALIGSVQSRKKQLQLRQNELRTLLVRLCDTLTTFSRHTPSLGMEKAQSAVSYLKSELQSNNIDIVEGLNRLVSIMHDMEELVMNIQILQGTSPLPSITGTVYRIRIGGFFEAIVDERAQRCALWTGNDAQGDPRWHMFEDQLLADELLRAARIRDGKALPDFADLPLSGTVKEGEVSE